MLVIAHRGASGTEPENTIRSFKKAEGLGVDMVELDVRRSKDGEIVVFHDHSLKRLFGVEKNVADATLDQLKEFSGIREIPTLDEVLASINCAVNIEIKVHGIEAAVLAKIKNFPHKVLISSFFPGVLKKIRNLDGKIPLALIFAKGEWKFRNLFQFLVRKVNLYSVHPQDIYVSKPSMILLRLLAGKVYVWTVNTEKEYIRMKRLGVDGVFTDYPELIKRYEGPSI